MVFYIFLAILAQLQCEVNFMMTLVKLTKFCFKQLFVNYLNKINIFIIYSLHIQPQSMSFFLFIFLSLQKFLVIFSQFLVKNVSWIKVEDLYFAKKSHSFPQDCSHIILISSFMIFRVSAVIFLIPHLVYIQVFKIFIEVVIHLIFNAQN